MNNRLHDSYLSLLEGKSLLHTNEEIVDMIYDSEFNEFNLYVEFAKQ